MDYLECVGKSVARNIHYNCNMNYDSFCKALNELREHGMLIIEQNSRKNIEFSLSEKGADFIWEYHNMAQEYGLGIPGYIDHNIICPYCGKKSVISRASIYMGDSGCEHKGWQLHCKNCDRFSGWWKTVYECAEHLR